MGHRQRPRQALQHIADSQRKLLHQQPAYDYPHASIPGGAQQPQQEPAPLSRPWPVPVQVVGLAADLQQQDRLQIQAGDRRIMRKIEIVPDASLRRGRLQFEIARIR